ncbi:CVNH domain-containing protein [Colletotrichum karsti]|uniref:CVNH domain-containing protein n=1 Tax=Colletotrichum karsti TaxID=1095194 RepID=A0A9P6HYX3_9PEZI|nr:CVNH domain-containing protein [Colletotrichum karsti]KAF9873423.1 CVNH domain-containing protein [Colletotrichum karsti]
MSFHLSAENIRVDDGHILHAQLRNENGDLNDTSIDLNTVLGNDNGRFDWSGGGFSDSAENIRFEIEGGENVPILRARLFNLEGEAIDADCNLSERIGNDNGNFVMS